MAIKGKKKSQARGSQARRRPATAPRPYGGGRPTTPWYATTGGKTVLAIAGAAVVVAVMWGVANAQSHERDLQRRQRSLNAYTDQVRAVLAMISPVTSAMDRAPTQASSKVGATLKKQSSDWVKGLQQVAPQVSRLAA